MSAKGKRPKFTLNGKTFNPGERPPSASKLKFLATLEALPEGALLDQQELCQRSGFGRTAVFANLRQPEFTPYRFQVDARKVYWGNRKTVALARKELERRENN